MNEFQLPQLSNIHPLLLSNWFVCMLRAQIQNPQPSRQKHVEIIQQIYVNDCAQKRQRWARLQTHNATF